MSGTGGFLSQNLLRRGAARAVMVWFARLACACGGVLLAMAQSRAEEPTLQISAPSAHIAWTRSQLLSRPDIEWVEVPDSEYGRAWTRFRAIRLVHLFQGVDVADEAAIQFHCTDGFAAFLEKSRLFSRAADSSVAYLAIEEADRPWPALPGKHASAGPFYLVWKTPRASGIGQEEWPYQLASFEVIPDFRRVFPRILPAADAGEAAQRGFGVFRKNCFACHRINGEGAGAVGPDLNQPMNPVEYFSSTALKKLIRDPKQVRTWPRQAMPKFAEAVLSDTELDDLFAYLRHMSQARIGREHVPSPGSAQ